MPLHGGQTAADLSAAIDHESGPKGLSATVGNLRDVVAARSMGEPAAEP